MNKLLLVVVLLSGCLLCGDFSEEVIKAICADENLTDAELHQTLSGFNNFSKDVNKGEILSGVTKEGRPYYYYIPRGYKSTEAMPLFIWLHGGVSRPEFIEADEYIKELGILPLVEAANFILLFPLAKDDCTWWQEAGVDNVTEQIITLKEKYNIDDDRVYMTGFSDGGSGTYHFALNLPDNFAAFYPLNGMISVGSHVSGNPSYLPNLRNRHLRVINTDEDELYPSERTRLTMTLALEAGADLSYREYWGIGHSWDYFDTDFPLLSGDMQKRARDVFQTEIYWECYDVEYGKCDWLEILELDSLALTEDWQEEYNVELPETRISFGFYDDAEYKGEGVQVKNVIENSLADEMGLKNEDVIFEMDMEPVMSIEELNQIKGMKSRGEDVSLKIIRDGEILPLEGAFPDTLYYSCFFYNRDSGAVKGKYYGNVFDLETSGVKAFMINIHPEMVNMEIPVQVIVNGETYFQDMVEYDRAIIEKSILEDRDRKAIWVGKIELRVE